mgnify:CR=1 FL=1
MQVIDENTVITNYQGRGRDALLPVLWDVQQSEGYISKENVHQISKTLRVPEADIYGVISFYSLFHEEPTGDRIIRVCTDPSCGLVGADDVLENTRQRAHGCTVESSPCLGMCDHAPAGLVSIIGKGDFLIPATDSDTLIKVKSQPTYTANTQSTQDILLKDFSQERYTSYGGYQALHKALENHSPEDIIQTIENSGLIGRGGAAFPTGLKWKFTRQADGSPKYVICNADESEPGTFKDRVLMEERPHLLLEGMTLAAYAVSAQQGIIFVRGEYPVAEKILKRAIAEAERAKVLGDNIMGSDFSFHVEIRRGAGAYICGEETALFEAIEGKRGFPRIKPPYPTTHGLFAKPTVVNNVETLCAVPEIINQGAEWFKSIGTEKSTGSKLVSVSGHVKRAGVYEIEPGITLRGLLDDFCGGVEGELQAVLMGGAAGTFLSPDEIDVKLTFEDLRTINSTFGSGAIMVFNDSADLRDILKRLAHFFEHESCGKCFPCQLGTQRQVEILERVDNPQSGDVIRLQDIGMTMTEASLCGLGQTAASAVMSAIDKFPHLFEEQ